MINCDNCKDLRQEILIRSPLELEKAIKVIKANIADKTIKQNSQNEIKFEKINNEIPWGDFIDYTFKCSYCGCFFELSVETYHGFGGSWKFKNI